MNLFVWHRFPVIENQKITKEKTIGDYWLTQYVLAAMGWGYALVCMIAIAMALWLPKSKKNKFLVTAIVIGLASILPFRGYEEYRKGQEVAQDYKDRLAKAQAIFEERCKTSGRKSIAQWMKLRACYSHPYVRLGLVMLLSTTQMINMDTTLEVRTMSVTT